MDVDTQNKVEFEKLLQQVLAFDVDSAPDFRLANMLAQRRARWLLSRTTDLFLQVAATLLVTVFSFAGLLIYIILRPTKTLSQLYEDSLEEEAFLQGIQVQSACPVCKQRAEPDFIFCPWCQTRLKRVCARCEQPMMLRWKACPYCGQAVQVPAAVVDSLSGTSELPMPSSRR